MSNATFLGMPPFPEAAVDALADDQLRRNLHNATHTIRDKRAGVIGELDDWEGLRTRAASLKDRALHGLDEHLVQLEEQLTARGVTVHWARTADEACQIVGDIAAGEVHPPRSRPDETCQCVQRGRLAGSAGADQAGQPGGEHRLADVGPGAGNHEAGHISSNA